MEKLWGGRFQKNTSSLMEDFNSSIEFDSKLYEYDILGSIAHASMLGKVGIISKDEAKEIVKALKEIKLDIESGNVEFKTEHEDIHMNIEVLLTKKIGDTGKKLHTARSRNDQVALDVRMYARDQVEEIIGLLKEWLETLIEISEKNIDVIMPGYTHLQRAQAILFSHNIMAYAQMAKRDIERLKSWLSIHNVLPLGSGALSGTTFPIDRQMIANMLGFDQICMNSIDGVSDRDFIIDFLGNASVGMMHLSRMCEELIIWSSQEFHFVEMDDQYSTGSSMMPQKKNPDAAELVRGKTARVYGDLINILTLMKGLPLAYNKDMQEDKECLFDGAETWIKCIKIMIPMVKTMKICDKNMENAAKGGFTNATDFADYLVKKGMAFRDAHKVTGEIVHYCIEKNINIEDVDIDKFKEFNSIIEEDLYDFIDIKNCCELRNSIGGTSSNQVLKSIEEMKKYIEKI